jgi:hypothetical protein
LGGKEVYIKKAGVALYKVTLCLKPCGLSPFCFPFSHLACHWSEWPWLMVMLLLILTSCFLLPSSAGTWFPNIKFSEQDLGPESWLSGQRPMWHMGDRPAYRSVRVCGSGFLPWTAWGWDHITVCLVCRSYRQGIMGS